MLTNLLRKTNDRLVFIIMGLLVPLFVLLPLVQIVIKAFGDPSRYYLILLESQALFDGVISTFELVIKVGLFTSTIGFLFAYIMTFYQVRWQKVLNILIILPLAIPVYVAAYTYTNIYYYLPFLETVFKTPFFMNGSVFIYTLFLYPYVYLASKSYLKKNLTDYIEASHTLGRSKWSLFFKIILPLSRPVIIGSMLFALFETLSDFAVVEYYGVLTLSRYVNLAWFSQGDLVTASKFALYILVMMFFLIFIERLSRTKKRYASAEVIHRPIVKEIPNIYEKIIIYGFIFSIIILGAVLPIVQMLLSVIMNYHYIPRLDILLITFNTLKITSISIVLIITIALLLTTITIYLKGVKRHLLSTISVIGYAIPSMVLALGLYLVFIKIDIFLYRLFSPIGLNSMLFTSSILILIIGFFIKFFSIAYSNLISAYNRMDHALLETSEILGENKLSTLIRVNIPILKRSIIAVAIILFIDMLKELTIVYSLRPFNFKTLSTEVYRYAGNEMINVAAFPSLIIIILCALLIIYLEEGNKK
ncbi:MAG: ABC transporter permease subunit [Candidatus Izimaplasma sp.]|nr:ABC transporter permease subunit [Candidatus Izimaplasma bacterium]